MKKSISLICKLYLILIPFQLLPIFYPLRDAFSRVAALQNSLFLLFIGLFLIMIYTKGHVDLRDPFLRNSFILPLILVLVSVVTSIILLPFLEPLYGEDTISASFSKNVYYVLIAFTFFFNSFVFRFVSKKNLTTILDALCYALLAIGILQTLIIFNVPGIATLYDSLNFLGILKTSAYIAKFGRIAMSGAEPSSIANLVGIFLLPYSMGRFLSGGSRNKYLVFIILFTVLSFFSLSSSVLTALVVDYLVFLILGARKTNVGFLFIGIILLLIGIVLVFVTGILDGTYVGEQLNYLLVEKTADTENLSTGYRYTTVVNDIVCFLNYPISGIGNGNQGFLYNSTMESSWISEAMRVNYQTERAMNGTYGLIAGGAFIPSYISGYGMIGILLLIRYGIIAVRYIRSRKESLGFAYPFYIIGSLSFLSVSTAATSIEGNFLVLFVLSLPMLAAQKPEEVPNEPLVRLRRYPNHGPLRGPSDNA